jgi:tetratricopeptide (TPR) repeat protein
MSAKSERLGQELEGAVDEVCASCGIAGVDDVKLKLCNGGCDLVKYCSDGCQELHREMHEQECKKRVDEMRDDIQRRAAELRQKFLRDKSLFEVPGGNHLGDCPICCLPLPIDLKKSMLMGCCSKSICKGCHFANQKREYEAGLEHRCAYCREPLPKTDEEFDEYRMERVKKNDPVAMREMGRPYYREGDYKTAFEYFTKAAELGDASAHFNLSVMYCNGLGVEKDEKLKVYHSEEAAIGGYTMARHNLGQIEWNDGRYERAVKHFIIAAKFGDHNSLNALRQLYAEGNASKEDYAAALHEYQAAVDATESVERDEAEAFYKVEAAARGNVSKEDYDTALREYDAAAEATKRCREGGSSSN